MESRFVRPAVPLFSLALLLGLNDPAAAASLCGAAGDGNGDCRISLGDHADFVACMSGPGTPADPACACYDMNNDGSVDLADAQVFNQDFTGDSLIAGCSLAVRADEPGTLRPGKSGSPNSPRPAIPDSSASDTVYLFSGEFHLTSTDMTIKGRGFDFEWTRRYRSKSGPDTSMGNGWDHSYNIFIEQSGGDLVLHDGDGRADEYCPNASGAWTNPEFFRELVTTVSGYSMVFHDRTRWNFHDFAGLPTDGKIESMEDTNGNRVRFEYDPGTGRLVGIRDTLDSPGNPRVISLAYDANGFIQSVTDFTGRQVTYDYYADPDIGGDKGDLKSVTTPIVVGTPNGNDFPVGKTTTYTYSEGLPDPQLNHNLLTITDPKGQTYLVNTYDPTLNPLDRNYDRLVTQQLGQPNELLQFFYLPVSPSPANNFATITCIVNDRVGNVEESSYDYRNRLVMIRQFTGRANPLNPTTDVLNRPLGQVRASDPPFFETRFEYNDESLLTRAIYPELDELRIVYESDLDYFAPPRRRSDMRERRKTPGPRGAAQPELVELYAYEPSLNGDTSQVTRWIDGRGAKTSYFYDANGNRTQTFGREQGVIDEYAYNPFGQMTLHKHPDNGSGSQREDQFVYYPPAAGPQQGYLQSEIIDAPGFALTTTYEYDTVGNVTRTVDPLGNDSVHVFNQLDQIVQSLSREVVPASGLRYETLHFYDANDNIVRIDTENRDCGGALDPNTHFTTVYDYEILNCVTRKTEEVDPVNDIVTEFEYDANRNRVLERNGEATNGNQPTNTVTTLYDERDLVFQTVRGLGDPDQSTDQYDYDRGGIITLRGQGLEGVQPREETYGYDGYNRLTIKGDSFGNAHRLEYDSNGNVVREVTEGEQLDVPGSAGNVRLAESVYQYDAMDRLTIKGDKFFDSTQSPITDGEATTIYFYSPSSHVLQITDDNGHANSCIYDSANRKSVCTDPKGNTVRFTYDSNSNVIIEDSTDKSDAGLPDELFTDTYGYDGLNRLTVRGDNFGNSRASAYDSRDLLCEEVDALGNVTRYGYDGMNRLVETERVLTDNGTGGGIFIGSILEVQTWDDSSRLTSQVDGNGNQTNYVYDALDRMTLTGFADGTSETYLYDVHDNKILHADANGNQIDYSYDRLNRLQGKVVTAGPGVSSDTTFEIFEYDGLDRVVVAQDDDSIVTREYDSLSNLVSESRNGVPTSSAYDGVGNQTQCTYPDGRVIDRLYDDLDRVSSIADPAGSIANFLYVGPERMQFRSLANGTNTQIQYDGITGVPNRPGDFGVKLPSVIVHDHPGSGTVVDVRSFLWGPEYNKRARIDVPNQLEHAYEYDSIYRLTRTVVTDATVPVVTRDTQYQLDTVGNRNFVSNDNCPGPYALNPASPPADFQMNQYTLTGCDDRLYDENGNLTQRLTGAPNAVYVYDYKDRLVRHDDLPTGTTTLMAYDALDRRIRKEVAVGPGSDVTEYFYDGAEVILEETNGGVPTTYVYGDTLDDVIELRRGPFELYYHADDMGNVMALTDSNGIVVERYEYQDYGQPEFFDGGGASIGGSSVDNPYLFTGRRYDDTSGLYYNRNRYLDPVAGRFISRDPVGIWHDGANGGNASAYAGSNPWTNLDATGEVTTSTRLSRASMIRRNRSGFVTGAGSSSGQTSSISKRAARTGRNPQTGKEIKIAAKNKVRFKAGSELSKKVNAHGGNGCPASRPYRCADGTCSATKMDCPAEIIPATGASKAVDHHGHVTVLKSPAGGGGDYTSSRSNNHSAVRAGATDHNSSRSNKTSSSVAPAGGDGGDDGGAASRARTCKSCGRSNCGGKCVYCVACKGDCRSTPGCGPRTWKLSGVAGGGGFHGHVTVLKFRGCASGPGYNSSRSNNSGLIAPGPGEGGSEGGTKGPGSGKKQTHRGHVTVLK